MQYVAEKALDRAVDESKAIGGMLVVLDPRTGELLALANSPRFNPNAPAPGIAAGALRRPRRAGPLRAGLAPSRPSSSPRRWRSAPSAPRTPSICESGSWEVGRHAIHDTHPHGMLTLGASSQVSSNIGAAKVAQRLGREGLVRTARRFGFGERTGLALPGEGRGSIPYPKADVTLATQAFGQGLSATAVQVAAAYGALANGGVLMRPYLVSQVVDPDGVVLLENQPTRVRQAVSASAPRARWSRCSRGWSRRKDTAPRGAHGGVPRGGEDRHRAEGRPRRPRLLRQADRLASSAWSRPRIPRLVI